MKFGSHAFHVAAIAGLLCLAAPLHAQDAAPDTLAASFWAGHGRDGADHRGVSMTGALAKSLDVAGPRWLVTAQSGRYRYADASVPGGVVHGRYSDLHLGMGQGWVGADQGLSLGAGLALHDATREPLPASASSASEGFRPGLFVTLTGHQRVPVGPGLQVFGLWSRSTASHTTLAMAQLGVDIGAGLSLGPEVAWLRAPDYRQRRLGLQLGGWAVAGWHGSLSAGHTRDQNGDGAAQLGLSVWRGF